MVKEPIFYEKLIIRSLFTRDAVRGKLMSHLDPRVFSTDENKLVLTVIKDFYEEHKDFPTISDLGLIVPTETYSQVKKIILADLGNFTDSLLMNEMEKFMREKLYSMSVIDAYAASESGDYDQMILANEKMQDALVFSFEMNVGLSFRVSEERLYNAHHDNEYFISTGIQSLDDMMGGGFPSKAITLFQAGTNVGKTLIQCACGTNILRDNKNVLYISMEEDEDILSKRFQGNLFDIEMDDIKFLTRQKFHEVFKRSIKGFESNLEIVSWESGKKKASDIRILLKEYKIKFGFEPDIVFVDYIGCMLPSRLSKTVDGNAELAMITDEVRNIGVEFNIPMVSGLQLNRGGMDSTDPSLSDTAASIASTFKADFIFGVTVPPGQAEVFKDGIYSFKNLKSRSSNKMATPKALVGVTPAKMRIYELDLTKQDMSRSKAQVNEDVDKEPDLSLIKTTRRNKKLSFLN